MISQNLRDRIYLQPRYAVRQKIANQWKEGGRSARWPRRSNQIREEDSKIRRRTEAWYFAGSAHVDMEIGMLIAKVWPSESVIVSCHAAENEAEPPPGVPRAHTCV